MFQQKIQNIKEEQKKYLINILEYHYLIEALLFKLQKANKDQIEYVTDGINTIDIYILKDKNIKEIRLPYFDENLQIWKNKLYNIDEIKRSTSNQIIDQYKIKIHEVEELNSQNSKELKALKDQIKSLQEENQKLKLMNEQIQEENQRLKLINEQIQKENTNVLNEKKCLVDITFDNDMILHDKPIVLKIDNQHYNITLDQIFSQNFNLKINNYNIEIKPCFQFSNVTCKNNKIYYNYVYQKQYVNCIIKAPEPFNQDFQIKLTDGATYHVIKKQNYNVYIVITLQ